MSKFILCAALLISTASAAQLDCKKVPVEVSDIEQCAEQGNRTAQYVMHKLYFYGNEVPKNYRTSFMWVNRAAENGDMDAYRELGYFHYNGWGTKIDKVRAYMWWSIYRATPDGAVVKDLIEMLENELSPAELDRAQEMAKEWTKKHRKK